MPLDASAIARFWTWFRVNDAKLKAIPNADHPFWDTALAQLQLVHRGLRFEMSDPVRGHREFVITAEGDTKLFALVDAMVAAAPPLKAWTFVALKPAMGFDFTHHYEDVLYDPKSMWFLTLAAEGRPDDLGLRIGIPSLRELDQDAAEFAVTIILETGLGERERAADVQYVRSCVCPTTRRRTGTSNCPSWRRTSRGGSAAMLRLDRKGLFISRRDHRAGVFGLRCHTVRTTFPQLPRRARALSAARRMTSLAMCRCGTRSSRAARGARPVRRGEFLAS
jgi:hypothetical protein